MPAMTAQSSPAFQGRNPLGFLPRSPVMQRQRSNPRDPSSGANAHAGHSSPVAQGKSPSGYFPRNPLMQRRRSSPRDAPYSGTPPVPPPASSHQAQSSPAAQGRSPSGHLARTPGMQRQGSSPRHPSSAVSADVKRRVSSPASGTPPPSPDMQRARAGRGHSPSTNQPVSADVRRRVSSPASGTPPASPDMQRARVAVHGHSPSRNQPVSSDVRRRVSSPASATPPASPDMQRARVAIASDGGKRAGTPTGGGRLQRQGSAQLPGAPRSEAGRAVPNQLRHAAAPPPRTSAGSREASPLKPFQPLVPHHGGPGRATVRILGQLEEILRPKEQPAAAARKQRCLPSYPGNEEDIAMEDVQLEENIGAGSFGAVWRGRFRGDVVAVKKCRVIDEFDGQDAEMLLLEIRYLRKLRHPRLVAYYGFCSKPPHLVMIMEFMPGGSLHALIFKKKTMLEFRRKASMGQQVAEGLTYLHEQCIVHRDLKTMNVVLDNELNCKICDFGLTFTLERTHLTVKALEGSPRYMAPEQFESKARITEKVDIWQMGCVLLELFCETQPFSGAQNLQQVATELLVRRRGPRIPEDTDPRARALIQACLRLNAKARPTAPALEEALGVVRKDSEDAAA